MEFKEYIWFWKTSWSYMGGSRMEFWTGLYRSTKEYRRSIIEERKKVKAYYQSTETKDI